MGNWMRVGVRRALATAIAPVLAAASGHAQRSPQDSALRQRYPFVTSLPAPIDDTTHVLLANVSIDAASGRRNPRNVLWAVDSAWHSPREVAGVAFVRFAGPETIGRLSGIRTVVVQYLIACERRTLRITSLAAYSETGVLGINLEPHGDQPLVAGTVSMFVGVKVCEHFGRKLSPQPVG